MIAPRLDERRVGGGGRSARHPEPVGDRMSAEAVGDGEALAQPTEARLAAVVPEGLIEGGETVILLLKPSLWFVVLAPLGTIAAIVAITALLATGDALLTGGVYSDEAALAAAGVVSLRVFWQFLEWLSRAYVLTDRRIIRVRGVLTVQVFECSLGRVQHSEVVRILREQLFGLGTVTFSTAGTGGIEAAWEMVGRPFDVQQEVARAVRRYGGRGGGV
ncbi:MAG: PH domain-containing protein [Planctomycetota bacterium]